ncbi:MAG: hypothetical protein PSX81_02735 [bacterium]|nr:hypothetical protein [bacterium]
METTSQNKPDLLKSVSNIAIAGAVVYGISQIGKLFGKSDASKNTQDDIKKSDDLLKKLTVKQSNLLLEAIYYKNIADNIYSELQDRIPLTNIYLYDFDKIYNWLSPLNIDELRQVAKDFGTRQQYLFLIFGLSDHQGTLFEYFEFILKEDEILKLRKLFYNSGIWGSMALIDTRETERMKDWKAFVKSDIGKPVYSYTLLKLQTMGAFINKVWTPKYTTLRMVGFGKVGAIISVDPSGTIQIQITDQRLKTINGNSAYGSKYWVNGNNWLKTAPPNSDKYPH